MAKYFRARKQKEVVAFLVANGFKVVNSDGDDDIWSKDGYEYTVKVPQRNEDIPMGTMDYMRKMIQECGYTKKDILNWWKDNGYGE